MKIQKVPQLLFLGFVVLGGAFAQPICAEIWTDRTGSYKIDAFYAGVEGNSVVLRKADGSTVKVPIARLSPESRALAKKMYESAKGAPKTPAPVTPAPATPKPATSSPATSGPATSGPAGATSSNAQSNSTPGPAALMPGASSSMPNDLNFTPPVAPTVPPLPAFPQNASLQDTVDFVRAEVMAGHPEVLWYAMPDRLRAALDSPEYREALVPSLERQAPFNDSLMSVVTKVVEILVTKKDFVLNSPLMAQIPPDFVPMVKQSYDPAVGLIYEFSMMVFVVDEMKSKSVTQMLDERGPRLGGHLQAPIKSLPPPLLDSIVSQVQVTQDDELNGSIQMPQSLGATGPMQMKKVDGRWLPADFAEKWERDSDDFVSDMKAEMEKMQAEDGGGAEQANLMMDSAVVALGGVLDPLAKAQTQQEFNDGLSQIMMMAAMLSQGAGGAPGGLGAPGGIGAPGLGPGGPPGPGPGGPPGAATPPFGADGF